MRLKREDGANLVIASVLLLCVFSLALSQDGTKADVPEKIEKAVERISDEDFRELSSIRKEMEKIITIYQYFAAYLQRKHGAPVDLETGEIIREKPQPEAEEEKEEKEQ